MMLCGLSHGRPLTLLGMDGFQHHSHCLPFIMRRDRKDILLKMNGTSLVTGIREHFRYNIVYTQILITDNELDVGKPPLFEPCKEKCQLSLSPFMPSAAPIILRNPSLFTTMSSMMGTLRIPPPATLEANTSYIGITTGQWSASSLLHMFISLLVEIAYGSGRYFGSPKCFCDIFYPAYGDTRQIYLEQGFFHNGFPAAVPFDDGS